MQGLICTRVRACACVVEGGTWATLLGGVVGTVSHAFYARFVAIVLFVFGAEGNFFNGYVMGWKELSWDWGLGGLSRLVLRFLLPFLCLFWKNIFGQVLPDI